jgi:hypothetical protein
LKWEDKIENFQLVVFYHCKIPYHSRTLQNCEELYLGILLSADNAPSLRSGATAQRTAWVTIYDNTTIMAVKEKY